MKIDFLICGSPNVAFYSQIAFFRLSLDAIGGVYATARVVAVFGADCREDLPEQWVSAFSRIDIEWASPEAFAQMSYNAQHFRRFEVFREDADIVILCDADVAPISLCDKLLKSVRRTPVLAGTIAHYPPPARLGIEWDEFSMAVIGKTIPGENRYTLSPVELTERAPFYINYGVLIGTPELFSRFYQHQCAIREQVDSLVDPWWGAQISLPLSCAALNLPTLSLPMKYNFPNDPKADLKYPDEMQEIVFLHYLRTNKFRRDEIFTTEDQFQTFLSLDLRGSNLEFQEHVKRTTGGRYPFQP